MKYLLLENLAILACSVTGFLSGMRYLSAGKALYARMIVQGVICVSLGRLYQCVCLLTGGSLTERYQVGILGIMGAFSFFFSANYSQIDSLVDDGGKRFRRYRIIALIGPLCILLMLILILLSPASVPFKISCAIVSGMICPACFYHVKHLMIPDVDYGVVRCLRGYNALAMMLSVLSMGELIALAWDAEALLYGSGAGLCALTLALVPVMDRGMKRWRT